MADDEDQAWPTRRSRELNSFQSTRELPTIFHIDPVTVSYFISLRSPFRIFTRCTLARHFPGYPSLPFSKRLSGACLKFSTKIVATALFSQERRQKGLIKHLVNWSKVRLCFLRPFIFHFAQSYAQGVSK